MVALGARYKVRADCICDLRIGDCFSDFPHCCLEHIGTKTAVQIRSHAQKFFSKVLNPPDCCDQFS